MTRLSEENRTWQAIAREVAEKVVRPLAKKYDDAQEYPWEIQEAMAEAGLFGVWIPEHYGGSGKGERNVLNLCLVIEELSRACGGVGVLFAVNALGSFPILVAGTEEQKQEYLPKIAKGETLIAFCLSEKNAGSDAQGLRVRAIADGDGWSIHGEKKWTTNGGAANLYTVFAVTDPESRSRRISAFLVEKDDPGFSVGKVEDKMGIRCVPVVETVFDGVKVGRDRLLGGRPGSGFKHAMGTLDLARPGVAAQAMGLAQGAMELATRYAMQREQFGQPVSSFQMVQKMLADMAQKTEAARQLIYAAAEAIDHGDSSVNKLAALSKCFATDVAMQVTTDAVQIFGGYGFMRDYPIEKYMRDAKITQIYEGTNQIQRMVIARNLMKEAAQLHFLDEYIPTEEQRAFEG
ncbi:MAG: acyl-CoA dehydrogenase [Planctomycetes bacterium]|nr:acyl-CoA dehydrogenase [Planctomycetota bacterium]